METMLYIKFLDIMKTFIKYGTKQEIIQEIKRFRKTHIIDVIINDTNKIIITAKSRRK